MGDDKQNGHKVGEGNWKKTFFHHRLLLTIPSFVESTFSSRWTQRRTHKYKNTQVIKHAGSTRYKKVPFFSSFNEQKTKGRGRNLLSQPIKCVKRKKQWQEMKKRFEQCKKEATRLTFLMTFPQKHHPFLISVRTQWDEYQNICILTGQKIQMSKTKTVISWREWRDWDSFWIRRFASGFCLGNALPIHRLWSSFSKSGKPSCHNYDAKSRSELEYFGQSSSQFHNCHVIGDWCWPWMDAAVELVHSVLIILFPWGGSACSSKESCLFKHQQKKEAHSVALFSVRYGTCHCPPIIQATKWFPIKWHDCVHAD